MCRLRLQTVALDREILCLPSPDVMMVELPEVWRASCVDTIGTAWTNQRTRFLRASGSTPVLWLGSSNEEGEYYTAVLGIFSSPSTSSAFISLAGPHIAAR
jgi:hypothetical protein